jgi:LemA protein
LTSAELRDLYYLRHSNQIKMNKLTLAIIVLVLVVAGGFGMFYMYGASVRDNSVAKQEGVKEAWGNVQSAYQRRADLIGNLVETVKGAAKTETNILIGVTEARAGLRHYIDSVGQVINAGKDSIARATRPSQLDRAGVMINSGFNGMRGFMTENYPEVKSIANFTMLQSQLEGTENRINTERDRYNGTVKEYNSYIRGTWRKMGLGLVGSAEDDFTVREMFEAKEGADVAPTVKF